MALVGIARLASQSELLEAKRAVEYFEIPARSILNRTKPNMPFRGPSIPYRGCEFGCKYCYARYTHEFMELDAAEFEDKIYAKQSAAHLLRQELGRIGRHEHIALGTATDPYQPAERRFGRTRAILEVFARERGRFLGITTKSDLVLRDIDLLREIARANVLGVNLTITTLDEKLARAARAARAASGSAPGDRPPAERRGHLRERVSQPDHARDHRRRARARPPGAGRARSRRALLRRWPAVPDALGAEGLLSLPGRAFPGTGGPLPRRLRPRRLSEQGVQGRPLRSASSAFASATGWPPA